MKKIFLKGILFAQLAAAIALYPVTALADDPWPSDKVQSAESSYQITDTDYYVIVEAPEGEGVFLYASPFDQNPIHEKPIPNQTILYIDSEVSNGSSDIWGQTSYADEDGYVPMTNCNIIGHLKAVVTELEQGSALDTDYDAVIDAENGWTAFYGGPGEKYGIVPGAEKIANGEKFHIYLEAELPDGSKWGQTNFGDQEVWVPLNNLDRTSEGPKPTPTPTPTPSPSPTPSPTPAPTNTPTPVPTATSVPVEMEEAEAGSSVSIDQAAESDQMQTELSEDPAPAQNEQSEDNPSNAKQSEGLTEKSLQDTAVSESQDDTTSAVQATSTEAPVQKASFNNGSVLSLAGIAGIIFLLLLLFLAFKKKEN